MARIYIFASIEIKQLFKEQEPPPPSPNPGAKMTPTDSFAPNKQDNPSKWSESFRGEQVVWLFLFISLKTKKGTASENE